MTSAPDMAASVAPKSDQINAEDLLVGPRTITITDVSRGSVEQPVDFFTAEFGPGRAYRPSKTMRRVIIAAWGTSTSAYIGRRITIYRDPEITFGRDKVGGIRISALSHLDKRLEVALTVTRGRRALFVVEPLPDDPPEIADFQQRIAAATAMPELDAVAKDLKARDLGAHRGQLLAAWSDRRAVISEPTGDAQ